MGGAGRLKGLPVIRIVYGRDFEQTRGWEAANNIWSIIPQYLGSYFGRPRYFV